MQSQDAPNPVTAANHILGLTLDRRRRLCERIDRWLRISRDEFHALVTSSLASDTARLFHRCARSNPKGQTKNTIR